MGSHGLADLAITHICRFHFILSMATDIVVGKEGRLVLPKKIRDRYGVKEGDRILVREFGHKYY